MSVKASATCLTLSVAAFVKWQYLCRRGTIEVTAYGIPKADDPLYVDDLYVPPQQGTVCTTETDEGALSDFALDMLERFPDGAADGVGRLWFHTHPAMSANPSGTDETTFAKDFGSSWAVMAILSRTDDRYARLRVQSPTLVEKVVPIVVDWEGFPPEALDLAARIQTWGAEYEKNVRTRKAEPVVVATGGKGKAPVHLRANAEGGGGHWYNGVHFTDAEWKQFCSMDYEPAAKPAKPAKKYQRRKWSKNDHFLMDEQVVYEMDGHAHIGKVVGSDGDWLTIRDDQTGELVEAEEEDVDLVEDYFPAPDRADALDRLDRELAAEFELDDAMDRLEARVDSVDQDASWDH